MHIHKLLAAIGTALPLAFALVLMTANGAPANTDPPDPDRIWGICNCGETCEGDCSTGPYICC